MSEDLLILIIHFVGFHIARISPRRLYRQYLEVTRAKNAVLRSAVACEGGGVGSFMTLQR